ncbi:MAG: 2-succinyl-5-enolpyruvyl-6-hydroxy-3-cyclohexene-1-carboxylic-acid synthase [Salibacteraceae bacterium]|nr:2-succinyl-5-enolpyruvyl-6-hydroxy-3-cyclohexene-1-carboxylic-acid synthase [Salibacteraceae bacterium]
MNTNKQTAILIAHSFAQIGGREVVVSPGSRNAPLIASFQKENLELHSVVDERSAGFIALGIAIASNMPVGLICTSGTALLNYAPAIAEAYYLGVSLIVFSADRPEEAINQGIGQTINQQNVFANFQKFFLQLPVQLYNQNEFTAWSQKILECLYTATDKDTGPVHINIPFEEPLYELSDVQFDALLVSSNIEQVKGFILSNYQKEQLCNSHKTLILCGMLKENQITNDYLRALSNISSNIIVTEHTSNLSNLNAIQTIDRVLELVSDELKPELVITLGENVISKKIKSFISGSNCSHWHISPGGASRNTFGKLDQSIESDINSFLLSVVEIKGRLQKSPYSLDWIAIDAMGEKRHQQFISSCSYSDLGVFNRIIQKLPFDYHIQSGNSSVVRYFQLFKDIPFKNFHANRGTSGIDGSTSTAVGYSLAISESTLLVTGDLSFMYDSNGLWNELLSPNLRIIIINNGGGGIFRIIPGPKSMENFETYFEGKHSMNYQGIVSNFGLEYQFAENFRELENELDSFFEVSSVAKVLEIKTPTELNDQVLKRYFNFIKTGAHEEMD